MNADKEYYLRELVYKFKLSPRQISLELANLQKIELLKKRISGKQHYFSINREHILFEDLQNIFKKTIGLIKVIHNSLTLFENEIEFAFIYGSVARDETNIKSDVDLMIIGNLSSRKISGSMLELGNKLNREINFSIFTKNEFMNRLSGNNNFYKDILKTKIHLILGNSDDFAKLVKQQLAENTPNK